MAGPFAVVVAGIVTYWLAVNSENSLVAGNYYKEGLGINRVIEREQKARLHGYEARVLFSSRDTVRVRLHGIGELPNRLHLRFIHPTQARRDRNVPLESRGTGIYEGALNKADIASSSRWYVDIEDAASTWRITGTWDAERGEWLNVQSAQH
jgi:hypothetical protein